MNRWQRFLQQASRSRSMLWRFAIGMLLLGVVLGWVLHRSVPPPPTLVDERILARVISSDTLRGIAGGESPDLTEAVLVALERELTTTPVEFEPVLNFVPSLASLAPSASRDAVLARFSLRFTPTQAGIAADLFVLCQNMDDEARKRLEAAAAEVPPTRHAAHALGLAALARNSLKVAYAHFRAEGQFPEASDSRSKAVTCLIAAGDFDTLAELSSEPAYAHAIDPRVALDAATHRRDWPEILRTVPRVQFTDLDPAITTLTMFAGLAWMFFLVHLGEVPRLRSGYALLCLAAFGAGILSTTPTIYAVIWQDEILGFSPDGDFIQSLVYFIGGVGVREELCKLALFLPFLPFLIRRGDELEVLIVASFIGLGFAIEENSNYYLESGGTSAVLRFLTANFFHTALTGLNGLALYRACTRGMGGVNELLQVSAITILAHGLYNALFSLPDPTLGYYLSMIVYILTCRYYFSRAHELRGNIRMTISLTGAFVTSISVLACAMLAFHTMRLGPSAGISTVAPDLIGTVVLLVMFFREFEEPLTE